METSSSKRLETVALGCCWGAQRVLRSLVWRWGVEVDAITLTPSVCPGVQFVRMPDLLRLWLPKSQRKTPLPSKLHLPHAPASNHFAPSAVPSKSSSIRNIFFSFIVLFERLEELRLLGGNKERWLKCWAEGDFRHVRASDEFSWFLFVPLKCTECLGELDPIDILLSIVCHKLLR